jgi:hypothetical protein
VYSSQTDPKSTKGQVKRNWKFESQLVGIDKEKMLFLTTRSINSLNLNFPYNGKNYGEITLRNSKQYEIEILFSIDKGQILCDVYVCRGKIKFDSSPSIKFIGEKSSDRSSNVLFIRKDEQLIELLKSSKKVLIEIPLYRDGNQILEFNVEGLNLERLNLEK